ncbi:MAG TPA: single-stranded DNA-binding protein [Mycobacteriales bacterium]|nr:single-stranded DNA-binding protein [Mycobacteriales bacterium]
MAVANPAGVAKSNAAHHNEVRLTGRLSSLADQRTLPSGDEVVSWRIVVDRPSGSSRAGIDAIDCVALTARLRQAALRWLPGQVIEVEGALRRRFWRRGVETASRTEVEVTRAKRVG